MTKNKTDLNNLADIFDKLDKEAAAKEMKSQAVSTSKRKGNKVDLSNLVDLFDKPNEDVTIKVNIEVTIGGNAVGSQMNWNRASQSNRESKEYTTAKSKLIHNRYESKCSYCGKAIEKEMGLMEMSNGKWSAIHIECAMKRAKEKK